MKYLLLLSLLISLQGYSCINEYNVNLTGKTNEYYDGLPVFYRSFDTKKAEAFVSNYDLENTKTYSYRELSDVSVNLAKLGRYKEALSLLQRLNLLQPNDYKIIANLGTLYELNGQVDSAYFYIKKAMELKPESHFGSEWVHLKILEAKKQLVKDPDWVTNNHILNLGLDHPFKEDNPEYHQVIDTIWQISYQLEERIPFSPEGDLIVANVLRELGDLLAIHVSVENAYVAYKITAHYDTNDKLLIDDRLKKIMPIFNKHAFDESVFEEHFPKKTAFKEIRNHDDNKSILLSNWIPIGSSLTIIIILLGVFRRAKKKRKQR